MWKTRTARPQYDAHRARRGGENGTVGARRERLWTPSRAPIRCGGCELHSGEDWWQWEWPGGRSAQRAR